MWILAVGFSLLISRGEWRGCESGREKEEEKKERRKG